MKVPRDAITDATWRAVTEGCASVERAGEVRLRLTGPGMVACLQGLVTCDVEKPGPNSHLFGALLTNKGMIVSLLWITRLDDQILLALPPAAGPAVREVLARSLPPRLCRFEDITASTSVLGTYGPGSRAGDPDAPAAGRAATRAGAEGIEVLVGALARGVGGIERLLLPGHTGSPPAGDPDTARTRATLEACRIFAGVPALGAEIDDRTLPQEVRFDELGGVSYTKGCYLGQETVARVHFRGHPNRRLVLLVLDREPPSVPLEVTLAGKAVGRLSSAAWSPELDAWVAQAVLRREVEDGATVEAAGGEAVVRIDHWLRDP